jgi:hypothetical protein
MKSFAHIRTRVAGVISMVNAFRALQDVTGAVVREADRAENLLRAMMPAVRGLCDSLDQSSIGEAFNADVDAWIAGGLGEKPCFDRTQAAFVAPADGGATFFIAPLTATNGPVPRGYYLECFLAVRDEPQGVKTMAARFPHPKNGCQSGRLILGSEGIRRGNCIVFFPENIPTRQTLSAQSYAFFFYNKFQAIYEGETMPRVRKLFGPRDVLFGTTEWVSSGMKIAECYDARAIWGYLHDYFHHSGPRPLDKHLQVKLDFFTGLLEEIKCDCQTAILAATEDIPSKRELVEFVLFERLFRYPGQPDALQNFDAGTGLLLFEWLAREGAICQLAGNRLNIDLRMTVAAMTLLVSRIEQLERIADDNGYRNAAEVFVRTILPGGKIGDRFAFPDAYTRMARIKPSERVIDFDQVSLY